MKINTKKGFSLIELSIVLIIIGLLVAGITGGASLIKSAELRATMSEIRNYQTAVNAYYTAAGELPGTDNSSEMDFANSGLAWNKMAVEGVIDNSTSTAALPVTAITAFSSSNSISSKYKGGYYALGYNTQMNQNTIFLFSGSSDTPTTLMGANTTAAAAAAAATGITTNPSITIKDAKFIDDKMDNGLINSGKVYSFTGANTGSVACAYGSETTLACSIAIGIGL